ncbi:peroxiredoxin family protein [Desulfoferrobacter suflitae]|uniref:peroxiredoxin family protein n=1 Tax=Desulfoferrobacter suflitae TaxID=2865782 RepID=UPI002164E661|nr:TlpA disulfide reductase family protein [Desulfoferrobacter suflitae]MCK8600395.1 TlpA family protein disulfide reductase [Desulfoferrobacter suflitae]
MSLSAGKIIKCLATVSLTLLFCGFLSLASTAGGNLVLASSDRPEPGYPAPDFELKDLDGKSFRLGGFRDQRAVLLYFWATWCPQCVSARPQIAKIREQTSPEDLEILGINVGAGDSLARLKRFHKGHPVSWPILYDEDERVTELYRVQGIPLYILVNKKGEIVYRSHELPNLKEHVE